MTGWLWIKLGTMAGALALVSVASSTGVTESRGDQARLSAPARAADPNVIDFSGLRDIRFGASMSGLESTGVVSTADPACGPTFTDIKAASPVFEGDQLVLIWAHAPLRTPEGVMVGTSVDDVKRAYPSAIALTPPAGSYTFPALLVPGAGDRAYLLLHDQGVVQKLIVGYERHVRLLFETGFGAC